MIDGQEQIYFIAGESLDAVKASPFLDRFNEREIEVCYDFFSGRRVYFIYIYCRFFS